MSKGRPRKVFSKEEIVKVLEAVDAGKPIRGGFQVSADHTLSDHLIGRFFIETREYLETYSIKRGRGAGRGRSKKAFKLSKKGRDYLNKARSAARKAKSEDMKEAA